MFDSLKILLVQKIYKSLHTIYSRDTNKLNRNDNIILAAFGGGFTWGSIYLKWAYDSNK